MSASSPAYSLRASDSRKPSLLEAGGSASKDADTGFTKTAVETDFVAACSRFRLSTEIYLTFAVRFFGSVETA